MSTITFQGKEIHTNGELPKLGAKAPDFRLVNKDLKDVSLADFKGKKKLLNIVPSVDTPVCAKSTKKFNDFAKEQGNAVMLAVSADLPFAASRFCGARAAGGRRRRRHRRPLPSPRVEASRPRCWW